MLRVGVQLLLVYCAVALKVWFHVGALLIWELVDIDIACEQVRFELSHTVHSS